MDKNTAGELSGKHCSKLGADVMVLTGVDSNGNEQKTCLSAHLCRGDDRKTCGSIYEEIKNDKNIK